MPVAIRTENISKVYQLGDIGTGTLSRDLERWFARIQGKEDPFLRIGETNDRTTKGGSDIVWSLKDINFEIEQGEAVGIIGRNGAGKSTLLKILSRVTSPTTGRITGKGRIASLLEVGTGFHPELTGRENIYLNGAIMGMRKREITYKFDEIVDFAGVERYIDTPVKRYSSGMYVRLAFAVAAHLESEILIVDEVLAVGDAEFQKKCLGKMGEVSKGEGRTVLFVSHNLGSINQLTSKALWLDKGQIEHFGITKKITELYYNKGRENTSIKNRKRSNTELDEIVDIRILDLDLKDRDIIYEGENLIICVKFRVNSNKSKTDIAVVVENVEELALFTIHYSDNSKCDFGLGSHSVYFNITPNYLRSGNYKLSIALFHETNFDLYDSILHEPLLSVIKANEDNNFPPHNDPRWGNLYINYRSFKEL